MRHKVRSARKFFGTPKGLLLIILVVLAAIAAPREGMALLPGLLGATFAAALVDLVILRRRKGIWEFPSGAVLSALIVAMAHLHPARR